MEVKVGTGKLLKKGKHEPAEFWLETGYGFSGIEIRWVNGGVIHSGIFGGDSLSRDFIGVDKAHEILKKLASAGHSLRDFVPCGVDPRASV